MQHRAPDARSEGGDNDHPVDADGGTVAAFGHARRVGVVDDDDVLTGPVRELGGKVDADPRLVNIRSRPDDAVMDDSREGTTERRLPVERRDDLEDDVDDLVRAGRVWRVDADPFGVELALRRGRPVRP